MQKYININRYLNFFSSTNKETLLPIIYTLIAYIIIKVLSTTIRHIINKLFNTNKKIYNVNKKIKTTFNILFWIILFMIWQKQVQNYMVLISLVSTGITLSIKEIIFNYAAGIYIKWKKPFKVEDRIIIGDIEGDVININNTNFEILEVNKENGEQSTGIIIHIPNSEIFTKPLKNITKVFKYVWNEIKVNVDMECDLPWTKSVLYRIINTNDIVKHIPKKMENAIDNAVSDYRIYYNKLNPIIYTKVVNDHIELSIRYLVHPKKARNVESEVWNKIIKAHKEGEIHLHID